MLVPTYTNARACGARLISYVWQKMREAHFLPYIRNQASAAGTSRQLRWKSSEFRRHEQTIAMEIKRAPQTRAGNCDGNQASSADMSRQL
jgi:hypothetical protein